MTLYHNDDSNQRSNDDGPVTVIVTRKARKEMSTEFEEWMNGIVYEAMKFERHMGVDIIRPTNPSYPKHCNIPL